MTRSPADVFGEAQAAKARGDSAGFFALFDRKEQLRLAANGMVGLLGEEARVAATFAAIGQRHAFPEAKVEGIRSLARQLMVSAQKVRESSVAGVGAASLGHYDLVKQHQEAVAELVASIPELPQFLADAEAAFRQLHGGGLVSSSLFLGEHLEDVVIEGNRAWATRVGTSSSGGRWTEDVGFSRGRKDDWRTRLLAKRPRSKRR